MSQSEETADRTVECTVRNLSDHSFFFLNSKGAVVNIPPGQFILLRVTPREDGTLPDLYITDAPTTLVLANLSEAGEKNL